MNTIYALILISSLGGVEEVYKFQNMNDCMITKTDLEQATGNKAHCVSVHIRKPSEEMKEFFSQFKEIAKEFKKEDIEPTI